MRNDLEALKVDGVSIFIRGVQENNDFAKAVGCRNLGTYYSRTGDVSKGILFLKKAASFFELKGDALLTSETFNELGNAYFILGDNERAIASFLKSIRIGRDSPDETSVFLSEPNLAQVYIRLGELDRAKALLEHYLDECAKLKKYEALSNAYSLLGSIFQQTGDLSRALLFFQKSAFFGYKSSSTAQLGHAYTNRAIVLYELGKQKESYVLFNKALVYRKKHGDKRQIAEGYFNLGEYYFYQGDLGRAEVYYDSCGSLYLENRSYSEYVHLQQVLLARLSSSKFREKQYVLSRIHNAKQQMSELVAKTRLQDDRLFTLFEQELIENEKGQKNKPTKMKSNLMSYFIFFLLIAFLVYLTVSSFGEDKSAKKRV